MNTEFKGSDCEFHVVDFGFFANIQDIPFYEGVNLLDKETCPQYLENAQLFAASKELLQLAIDTLNMCDMLIMPTETQLIELSKKCESAINKALGKQ